MSCVACGVELGMQPSKSLSHEQVIYRSFPFMYQILL